MARKAQTSAKISRFTWAILGGKKVDVDDSVREFSWLGRGFFGCGAPAHCQGMTIATFANRKAAREELRAGPKHRTPGTGVGGKDNVAFPNARVERVRITIEPA